MTEKNRKILIRLAMLLVCTAVSFLSVAAVYKAVSPEVFWTEEQRQEEARKALVGGQELSPVTDKELAEGVSELYCTEDGSVLVTVTEEGFDSDVTLRIGIASDGTVSGIAVVEHNETPELGGMALKSDYLNTYLGAASTDGIDGFSGASFTSAAIREAVDTAVIQYMMFHGIELPVERPEAPAVTEELSGVKHLGGVSELCATEDGGIMAVVTAKGFKGDVVLRVAVDKDGVVSYIELVSHGETPKLGGKALEGDYIYKYLGTADPEEIDVYSGASFTSAAVKEAVSKTIEQLEVCRSAPAAAPAGEVNVEGAALVDGVSELKAADNGGIEALVTVKGFKGDIVLRITVAPDGSVSGYEVVSSSETPKLGGKVLDAKKLEGYVGISSPDDIDVMAGATGTSNALREAVGIALEQFGACTSGDSALPAAAGEVNVEDAALVDGVSELKAADNGGIQALVTVKGFKGDIVLRITVAPDGSVSGYEVVSSSETPKLGGKVLDEKKLEGYVGISSPDDIDVMAGATGTSNALREAVGIALAQLEVCMSGDSALPAAAAEAAADPLADALLEQLGEGYEQLDCELADKVSAVYSSDKAYAVYTAADGHYKGTPIKLLVILDKDGVLTHISVIEQNETDGIGSNVFNEAYLSFYEGGKKFKPFDFGEGTLIDMYSGATETSLAVFGMVDAATRQYELIR